MPQTFDFLVIGAGAAGASAAYWLSSRGRVAMIEQEQQPGYHSTSRSAAVLSAAYGPRSWQILTAASAAFYGEPPLGFCEGALAAPRGALYLAAPGEEEALRSQAADLERRHIACELMTASAAAQLVPVVRMEPFTLGLFEPGCVDLDANALLHGYLRLARRKGARLFASACVTRIERRPGTWIVEAGRERIEAPVLVNAAGAWADEIAALAGLARRGVKPLRRTAIAFDPPADHDALRWPMTFDVAETWYFKPEGRHIMMSPTDSTPTVPCDAQPDAFDIAVAIDRIETVTTMRVGRLAARWAGLRTFADDHEAVIGRDPDEPSFVWYAGQGGNGVMASAAAGELAAAATLGEPIPARLADLGLSSAAISPARLRAR